jgi:hypothetical protein
MYVDFYIGHIMDIDVEQCDKVETGFGQITGLWNELWHFRESVNVQMSVESFIACPINTGAIC